MDILLLAAAQRLRAPWLDRVMPAVTHLADNGLIWIVVAAALLAFRRTRRGGVMLALALIIDLIFCNGVLKPLFHRVRPFDVNPAVELLIARPTDYSFPSGHTAVSFAAATVIWPLNRKWGVAAFALAALIALSRLYLYVHYPSDILGGALAGALFGYAAIRLTPVLEKAIAKRGKADHGGG